MARLYVILGVVLVGLIVMARSMPYETADLEEADLMPEDTLEEFVEDKRRPRIFTCFNHKIGQQCMCNSQYKEGSRGYFFNCH